MRLLSLRFKNLNSLYGEWEIDFTHPDYSGIFALIGPTGAGKTTVLDAICLGLYGRTPRLNQISKSTNDSMSRHTGECFAQVVFESQAGRFCAHWSQHRARKKADQPLQDPLHELSCAVTQRIIESKKSRIGPLIAEKTGMTFTQFTRTSLLAQGHFDAFLSATTDGKSDILEQITGTEVYSDISIQVHTRYTQEKQLYQTLLAACADAPLLSDDACAVLHAEQITEEDLHATLMQKKAQLDAAKRGCDNIQTLVTEKAVLRDKQARLTQEKTEFAPYNTQLEQDQATQALTTQYAVLEQTRVQKRQDQAAYDAATCAVAAAKEKLTPAKAGLDKATHQLRSAQTALDAAQVGLRAARDRLSEYRSATQALADASQHYKTAVQQLEIAYATLSEQRMAYTQLTTEHAQVQAYLTAHKSDARLDTEFPVIQDWLVQLNDLCQTYRAAVKQADEHSDNYKKITLKRDKACADYTQARSACDDLQASLEKSESELAAVLDGRTIASYQAEKEAALQAQAIAAHRGALVIGEPCPLCGSLVHSVDGVVDNKPDLMARLSRIRDLQAIINDTQARLHQINKTGYEKACLIAQHEHDLYYEKLTQIREKTAALSETISSLKTQLNKKLSVFSLKLSNTVVQDLRVRRTNWQAYTEKRTNLDQAMQDVALKTGQQDAYYRAMSVHQEARRVYAAWQACERAKTALSDANPDKTERDLNTAVARAAAQKDQAETAYQALQTAVTQSETQAQARQHRLDNSPLAAQEAAMRTAIYQAGFENEAAFLAARLAPETRRRLQDKKDQLAQATSDLATAYAVCDRQITHEQTHLNTIATAVGITDWAKLPDLQAATAADLTACMTRLATVRHRLIYNEQVKHDQAIAQAKCQDQAIICENWGLLHGLIGSADGKKYRAFAQGLTFNRLVTQANQQLEKMTDRYTLLKTGYLDLNVIDRYQADAARSIKNLSGGERFLVSVALALGLSQMTSETIRVDSLFLDEGFGTLDDDALDIAIEALISLQQTGKIIGIISHVPALQNRLDTQIRVKPDAGGRSALSGPGVRKITVKSSGK